MGIQNINNLQGKTFIPKLLLLIAFLFTPFLSSSLEVPSLTGPVVDKAGLLGPVEKQKLAKAIVAIKEKWGPQIQILIMESLEGASIEEYSIKVTEEWKLGDAKREDGLLILVALQERSMRIEVGRGLEGLITDVESSRIIRQMGPYFKAGQYFDGFALSLSTIVSLFGGELDALPIAKKLPQKQMSAQVVIVWIIFIILFIFMRGRPLHRRGMIMGHRGGFGHSSYGGGFGGGGWSGGGGGFSGGGASGKW